MSKLDAHTSDKNPPASPEPTNTTRTEDPSSLADRTQPQRLLTLLRGSGWHDVGHRTNSYTRLQYGSETDNQDTSVIVPLDREASDFSILMKAALETIQRMWPSTWQRSIEPFLGLEAADVFNFRKETSAPYGLIAWNDGRDLIESARMTLVAGAKYYMEPSRHFSNRFGQFANRYLDQILMGQSGTGSYIVTAVAPAEAQVTIGKSTEGTKDKFGVHAARAREVTSSVVRALEATTDAIKHFKSSGSMTGFVDQVEHGVSYELVVALRDIAGGADESDITVRLAPLDQTLFDNEPSTRNFEFLGGDTSVLERASIQLSTETETERVTVEGRVHLLTKKEAASPGVVGVDDGSHRYRVRLGSDEEYHEAVMAHDENRSITVVGELSREGSFRWLYGARLLTSQFSPPQGSATEADQMQIGFSE